MERREKTEFLLEQMRLLIGVAKLKDEEAKKAKQSRETGQESSSSAFADGEAEWAKVRVGGRKVNEPFLKEKANEVSKAHLSSSFLFFFFPFLHVFVSCV